MIRPRKRALAAAVALVCAGLSLAACSSSSDSGTNSAGNAGDGGSSGAASASFDTSHCPSSASSVPSGDTLTLGSSGPLTGPLAPDATIFDGVKAYFDYVNSQGGVDTAAGKKKLKLNLLDDGYVASKTVQNVQQLVQQDNVFALTNVVGSPNNLAIAPYITSQCVPMLFAEGAQEALGTAKYPFGSNAFANLDQDGFAIGNYLKSIAPSATVAVLYQDDAFGQPIYQGLKEALQGSDVKIVKTQTYGTTDVDVKNQMTTLAASKAEYFVSGSVATACTQSFKYLETSSWQPKSFVTDACGGPNLSPVSAKVTGNIIGTEELKGIGSSDYKADPGMQLMQTWVGKEGGEVNAGSEYGWYGAELAVNAIKNAKQLTRIGVAEAAATFPDMTPGVMLPGVSIHGWKTGTPVISKLAITRYVPADNAFSAPIKVVDAVPPSS